jgi:GntR family transcriptional regulator/MocR family aminotransferase
LFAGLKSLDKWLDPIPSEAGMHTAARLRDPDNAHRFFQLMREHAPGAQSIAEYAMAPLAAPAVVFGYGVIDADEITARLAALKAGLLR